MLPTRCEPDSANSTLRTPVAAQGLPLRVRDVMSVSIVTIPPSLSVYEAHTLMQRRKVRHLPVLQDGCLVGTVEARDEDRPFSCVFVPVPEPKAGKNRLHLGPR